MPTPSYDSGGLLIPVPPPFKTFATRLRQTLLEFEQQLKETENFRIVAFLGGKAFSVDHIAIRGSELAVLDGPADETDRYRILCHVGSLQLMLQVVPKSPHERRRKIGFLWEEDTEAGPPAEPPPDEAPAAVSENT